MALEYTYVFQLPASVVLEISNVLDPSNTWEEIAAKLPNICDIDIEFCNKLKTERRPTEALLWVWGTKGYKIEDLYIIFYQLKLIRCMKILLLYVDKELIEYTKNCVGVHSSVLQNDSYLITKKINDLSEVSKHLSVVYPKRSTLSPNNANYLNLNDDSNLDFSDLQNTPSVKYEEVLEATKNFDPENILGRGGYGIVYKGVWKHLEVAIKRIQTQTKNNSLKQQKERIRQSLQELRTLAKFRHENILSLYGYSMDGNEPCLIYQFMLNGSLEDRLLCKNGTKSISWSLKLSICKKISCGLYYLHSITNNPIIHGDVKSANILLDKHMEPKLGDFGLCRNGQVNLNNEEKTPMIASHIQGTLAYLPPEFTTNKVITTKLDVYSFGVVLLEVAIGQRAYSDTRNPQKLVDYILKFSADLVNEEKFLQELSDKKTPLLDDSNILILKKLLTLGASCTQNNRFFRPPFKEIFNSLSFFNE